MSRRSGRNGGHGEGRLARGAAPAVPPGLRLKQSKAHKKKGAERDLAYERDDMMDLHGLHVYEAIHVVDARLRKVDARLRSGEMALRIIVGQGIHSRNGPKIKPAVAEHLTKNGYPFKEDRAGGMYTVSFSNSLNKKRPRRQRQQRRARVATETATWATLAPHPQPAHIPARARLYSGGQQPRPGGDDDGAEVCCLFEVFNFIKFILFE